jgi:hypothetical protein
METAPVDGREIIAVWKDARGTETPVFVFYCPSNGRHIGRNGSIYAGHGLVGWYPSPRLIYQTRNGKPLSIGGYHTHGGKPFLIA